QTCEEPVCTGVNYGNVFVVKLPGPDFDRRLVLDFEKACWHSYLVGSLLPRSEQPKTGKLPGTCPPPVTAVRTALAPSLSPSCPRAAVMPPRKTSVPAGSYSATWPETVPPKRFVSIPFSS